MKAALVAVAFAPDGKTALTGASDNTARLWVLQRPFGRNRTHFVMDSGSSQELRWTKREGFIAVEGKTVAS